jgi:hypothetical protein
MIERRRADNFRDAPEHSPALDPATDPRPALLELDAASAADHPPGVELPELGPGTIGQRDLTHETRRNQPRVRLISGLLTTAKVTRHARTLQAPACDSGHSSAKSHARAVPVLRHGILSAA